MAQERTERDRLADTVTAKLENLVKSWWFQRVYHSWFGKKEEDFTSEINALLAQVNAEKAALLRDELTKIDQIASQTWTTAKQAAVMTKVKEYLEAECTWKDVQSVISSKVGSGYNDKKPCPTELIVEKAKSIALNPTALAIQKKIKDQITAYLARYPGVKNAKTEVMKMLFKYLDDKATWTDVQAVINANKDYSSKWFYSQVESTVNQVKEYKVKMGEIREDIPAPFVEDQFDAADNERITQRVDDYIDKNKTIYAKLDEKHLLAGRAYTALNPDQKATLIKDSEGDSQTFQKREIVTAVKHYLDGNLSWVGVRELMRKYPKWDAATKTSELKNIIKDIEKSRPNETAHAVEVLKLMHSIKAKMQEIIDNSPSNIKAKENAEIIKNIIEFRLLFATAHNVPDFRNVVLTKQTIYTRPEYPKQCVDALVQERPELNPESILGTILAFDERLEAVKLGVVHGSVLV